MQIKKGQRIRAALVKWYRAHHRQLPWRDTRDPYRIWVSEVMLQQTQVKTVLAYYLRFLNAFPDLHHLAAATSQDVLKVWEGLGYYARARNLRQAAGVVEKTYQGRVPDDRDLFIALPGVGKYISAAVLSMAFDRPYAVVDGNVKRLLARLFLVDQPVNASGAYQAFEAYARVLLDRKDPGIFNQAMMELGALVCQPRKPLCDKCPLAPFCLAHKTAQEAHFPTRLKKRAISQYRVVFGVIFKKNRILITKRKEKGLLGGLWEFPGGKVEDGETPEQACIREIKEETGLTVTADSFLTQIRHAYTHFKITGDVFICQYVSGRVRLEQATDFKWVTFTRLNDFPLPGANRKILPSLARYRAFKQRRRSTAR